MFDSKCKTCGGKLSVSVNSGYAQCENCGNPAEIDPGELDRIRGIYESADRKIRLNSAAGYKDAINQLQTIPFVSEARDKIAFCETRLAEIKEAEAKRTEIQEQTDKNDTKTGIIIIVLIMLVILLVIAGAIYIAVHLYRGDLSPKAVTAIVSAIVVFAVLTIIGKIKS